MAKIEGFEPAFLKEAQSRSYRAFYKWGDQSKYYAPSSRSRLYEYVRDSLSLSDDFFKEPNYANDSVQVEKSATGLDIKDVDALRKIVGEENVYIDLDARISSSITKTNDELVNMHEGVLPPIVDAVVCPSLDKEIVDILAYAKKRKIKVTIKSALIAKETDKKTIALDLTKRYNKVLEFNEVDSYAWVEVGMYLPILEDIFNNAPYNFKDYNVENKFTIGHFPMEYEECTLYDMANGIKYGTEAGYYGNADDIIVDRVYLTADGESHEYEDGTVLAKVKLRLVKYYPHNRYGFSYMFKNWQEAVNALREIYSKNTAIPMHIKLSDAKETSLLMRYYMLDDSIVDSLLKMFKLNDGERCLMVGFSGGAYTYSRLAFNSVRRIAKKYKAKSMTTFLADAYLDSRYNEMYVREMAVDFGISTTTEMHSLSWSELPDKYMDIAGSIESGYTRSRIISASKDGVILEVVKNKV